MTPEAGLLASLFGFVAVAAVATALARRPTTVLVGFAAYSLGLAMVWVVFDAPDVALTEAAVGAGVTTALLLVMARRLSRASRAAAADDDGLVDSPPDAPGSRWRRTGSLVVAALVTVGILLTVPSLPAVGDGQAPAFGPATEYYLTDAGERGIDNVVTAVLVVYRGFDTFGEVAVVFAAAVAVLAVLGQASGEVVRVAVDQNQSDADPTTDHDDSPDVTGPVATGDRPLPPDSIVVTVTVRLLAPFVLTFALFTLFHGTSSVGGGFQGGVVAAATVVTLAFAFGVEATAAWLSPARLLALAAAGPVVFCVVALAGIAAGGAFLQFDVLPIAKASVYATEAIELGIGATVGGVVVLLFVALAARTEREVGR
ncbi:DUF4040 domain-containing protein [Haloarchaeobius sp. DFWS5]|uniref:DUF4040 domain-containing protein n=1 Tax=Haloarchaeobius sp. DFWS5 TaxID=3446114 RepID=UPI003EB87E08